MVLYNDCRPTRRGSTFTLGERAWLDGFDGNNDVGVFFAASLRDHSIYLLKWKVRPPRKATVNLELPEQPGSNLLASSDSKSDSDDYVTLVESESVKRPTVLAATLNTCTTTDRTTSNANTTSGTTGATSGRDTSTSSERASSTGTTSSISKGTTQGTKRVSKSTSRINSISEHTSVAGESTF